MELFSHSNFPHISLAECSEIITGSTPSKVNVDYWGGDIPFITPVQLGTSTPIIEAIEYVTKKGALKGRMLERGTILVCCIGSLGKVGIAGTDIITNQQINAIKFDSQKVNPKYGYYIAKQLQPILEHYAPSTTVKIIKKSSFKKIKIPLPPLTEQKRIADILDAADALRAKRRQAIAMLDEFLQASFLEMFGDPVTNPKGWGVRTISEITNVLTGSTPSRKKSEYYDGTTPWVKTTEVNGNDITVTGECISDKALNETNCKLMPINSIILAMYGQGKTRGQVSKLKIKAATNQACAVILPTEKANMDYFFYYLSLSYEQLRNLGRGGNQPNLNLSLVKCFEVPLPPLELQTQFAKLVEQVETQKAQQKAHLAELDTLFGCLQQRAFSGELFPEHT